MFPVELGVRFAAQLIDEARDHLAVQVRPHRFPMKQHDDLTVSRAFIDVMHAEVITAIGVGDFDVVRCKGIAVEVFESFVGSSKCLYE